MKMRTMSCSKYIPGIIRVYILQQGETRKAVCKELAVLAVIPSKSTTQKYPPSPIPAVHITGP
jgi:hypothetical protein